MAPGTTRGADRVMLPVASDHRSSRVSRIVWAPDRSAVRVTPSPERSTGSPAGGTRVADATGVPTQVQR